MVIIIIFINKSLRKCKRSHTIGIYPYLEINDGLFKYTLDCFLLWRFHRTIQFDVCWLINDSSWIILTYFRIHTVRGLFVNIIIFSSQIKLLDSNIFYIFFRKMAKSHTTHTLNIFDNDSFLNVERSDAFLLALEICTTHMCILFTRTFITQMFRKKYNFLKIKSFCWVYFYLDVIRYEYYFWNSNEHFYEMSFVNILLIHLLSSSFFALNAEENGKISSLTMIMQFRKNTHHGCKWLSFCNSNAKRIAKIHKEFDTNKNYKYQLCRRLKSVIGSCSCNNLSFPFFEL